ncbi:MAG: hypothetical protein ACF8NJ_00375 [Phycisphaerales bacterium JB038]
MCKPTMLSLATLLFCGALASSALGQPTADDPDWLLRRVIDVPDPWAVHISWFDSAIYVGRRNSGDDGVFRIELDNTLTKIVGGSRPAGVFADPLDGDVYFTEDYGGSLFRWANPDGPKETWVSGWHSGDDDPCGMAVAPATYMGPVLLPGQAVMIDRGSGSEDGLWGFSLDMPENEWEIVGNSSALQDAVDVAISDTDVYIADAAADVIWILQGDGTLLDLQTSEPLDGPCAITIDPVSGDLIVAESVNKRIVRIDPLTGNVAVMFSGFLDLPWASVEISMDGVDIVVSDSTGDKVYVFSLCESDYYPYEDCNGNGFRDFCDIANGTSEDVDFNGVPDECECVGDLDGDNDCDQGDLGILLAAYLKDGGGDLDHDGDTDQSDLGILLYKYGSICD